MHVTIVPGRCTFLKNLFEVHKGTHVSVFVFQASLSIWGWGGLGVVLFLVTFGPFAIFYLAFYIFCFIGG